MQLSDFVGQTLGFIIPGIHPTTIQRVKILGVEAGGVWIQSQTLTNAVLEKFGAASAPKTMVFFLPYHAISVGFASIEEPALNEKAFGV
jgi:hypothetical protein